jgi:hypothetical protein
MVLACRSIIRIVGPMAADKYLADEKIRYAVMRGSPNRPNAPAARQTFPT